ncbi:MAG TPA: hypothetical protein VGX16_05120 [Solirubrobacteraceae bacterium]|nr:hypothetical protein [Solirubrobacteraceae bacterium]
MSTRTSSSRLGALIVALAACTGALASLPTLAHALNERVHLTTSFKPNRLGVQTTFRFAFTIAADRNQPSPLTEVDLHLPAGIGLATSSLGLAICETAQLEKEGLTACSPNSLVGHGSAAVQAPFEDSPIEEPALVFAVMGPQDGEYLTILFYAEGSTPISAQLVFPGHVLADANPFSGRLDTVVPPIPTVPEGPFVAVTRFSTTIGPAGLTYYRRYHGRRVPFRPRGIVIPKTCPRGGFPFTVDFGFMDGVRLKVHKPVPCPPRRRRH